MQAVVNVNNISIIRPLLNIPKSQLIDFMKSNNFEWSEDSSNAVAKYKRNKVRLNLVPILAEIAGGEDALLRRFNNLAAQSSQINTLLESLAYLYLDNFTNLIEFKVNLCRSIYLSLPEFITLEPIVQSKVIQILCAVIDSSVTTEFVAKVILFISEKIDEGLGSRALDVNNEWQIIRYSRPILEITRKSHHRKPHELTVKSVNGLSIIAPIEMQVEIHDKAFRSSSNDRPKSLFSTFRRIVSISNIPLNTSHLILR